MPIVGDLPETGVRVAVERPRDGGPPWRYEGEVATPAGRLAMTAVVEADGAVAVQLPDGAPAGLAEKARLLVRAAFRHAREDDSPPPRRIVRWRADA